MRILVASCLTAFAACAAKGDILCFGDGAEVSLDLTVGTRMASPVERIQWSVEWEEGAPDEAVAIVAVDGETLDVAIGSGLVEWTPVCNGTYTLTHRVMQNGAQIGETLTATFRVDDEKFSTLVAPPEYGELLCAAESGETKIDLTPGTRTADATETLAYSSEWNWAGVALPDSTSVIEVDGAALNMASGSGFAVWTPLCSGTYTLTHRVVSHGMQIGEALTATFRVEDERFSTVVAPPEYGELLCAGESGEVRLDLTPGARTAEGAERVFYSPDWEWVGGVAADSTAVVEVNGETLSMADEGGSVGWTPNAGGTYTFTHRVMSHGMQIGETLTATFIVDGFGHSVLEVPPDFGELFCVGESDAVRIDLLPSPRLAEATERIVYSPGWGWADDASPGSAAIVKVDGEPLIEASGSGIVNWRPRSNGLHVLTHKVVSHGMQVGETLTATFLVDRPTPETPVFVPESGTTFDSNLSVSISCPTEGAVIHYTTDGSEPTEESAVYRRFRIYGRTTVKAIAELNGALSDVAVAEYARGRCAGPVILPADGTVFEHSDQEVSIDRADADGVMRYTLDGSDPTPDSPIYEEPFTISESTVVKAKVFGESFFDSSIVTASLTRVWVTVATPQIEAEASFIGSKTLVTISCATEGAVVRYTVNGSEPNAHSTRYTGPFYVAGSCTVKAYAAMADCIDSSVATQEIVKLWGIGDTLGMQDQAFGTGGDLPFVRVVDATAPNGESMRSGAITHGQTSLLTTTVNGPGTLSFKWRTSCEEDPDGYYEWDHAEFAVDGTVVLRIDGINDWRDESVSITGAGDHVVEWRYVKDSIESGGEDAAWVACVSWRGEEDIADPIPEIDGDDDVAGALAGSADGRLAEYVTTAAEYNAYRGWVDANGLDHKTVKESPRAWLSYALDAQGFVEREFGMGDIVIKSLAVTGGEAIAFEVDVDGVGIGANAKADNLAHVFTVEGSDVLDESAFSATNVTAVFGVAANGRLSVAATPKIDSDAFFIRVCMYADAGSGSGSGHGGEPIVYYFYTVAFDANGGTGGASRIATSGEALGTLPSATREGHDFAGWWTAVDGGIQVGASTVPTNDVTYYAHWARQAYCVVDLSAGADASAYPVSYLSDVPSGGWTDDYKTTKLVLRLIEPGSFWIGWQCSVTLTKPYYCGVFEVTQKQYELVTGSKPSRYRGDMRPVDRVSWNAIRGNSSTYNWPGSSDVNPNSFLGRLQARTGLMFDLPTEAQWEYACRAGTDGVYNNGGDTEADMNLLGRCLENQGDGKGGYSQHTTVGSYLPNDWGLYDMHGNVLEWCLDWYDELGYTVVVDPVGPSSGDGRVVRGGCWGYNADMCTSVFRLDMGPSSTLYNGFRIVRSLAE